MDEGGILAPGPNLVYNAAGAPEELRPPGKHGKACVHLHFNGTSNSGLDQWAVEWIKKAVREQGGGDVQTAFGQRY